MRFVTGLYRDLLHRTPQETEVAGWVAALAARLDRGQLALFFAHSLEYRSNLIVGDYQRILGRTPSATEVDGWSRAMAAGLNGQQVESRFLGSVEYWTHQGSNLPRWLTALYQDTLGRAPDAAGLAFWTNVVQQGVSRENVALALATCSERNAHVVRDAFEALLHRKPDESGFTAFLAALNQGLTPVQLQVILVGSQEYFSNQTRTHTPGHGIMGSHDVIPDFGADPDVVSAGSGAWSDPRTWSLGRVPTGGDIVAIGPNTTVILDKVLSAPLKAIEIQAGGRLRFRTDVDTQVVVGNLLVLEGGELEIGSEANPVAANVTAKVRFADQPLDLAADPGQYGTGLIAMGKVTVHGAVKTPTFVRLAAEPRAGDSALAFERSVAGWQPGDELVLPDTRVLGESNRSDRYVPQWEELRVQSISADGRSVTLASPLRFDHPGGRNSDGAVELLPHVLNRTRNVVIESANAAGTRGHTLFMERADVDIRYAAFRGLGRTTVAHLDATRYDASGAAIHIGANQPGRYPLHMHHLAGPRETPANGYQFTLVGNAVDGAGDEQFKWGITVHDSHYGLVKDNVVYGVGGAGIVGEDGSESFNVIEHNMVVRVSGTEERIDNEGAAGSGFWFRGPNNYIRDNVAANIHGNLDDYGFLIFAYHLGEQAIPSFKGADPSRPDQNRVVNMNATPLLEFARNEAYGAMPGGLSIWWIGSQDGAPYDNVAESLIKDFKAWNFFRRGIFLYPTNHVTIDGLMVRGGPDRDSFGILFGDYSAYNSVVKNVDIQGMGAGISMPSFADQTLIQDSYLRNFTDIIITTPYSTNGSGSLPEKKAVIRNVRFAALAGEPLSAIWMKYYPDGANLVLKDEVFVYDYNGRQGDNFQVFYYQQDPDFIVPRTTNEAHPTIGSPEAGLTNRQNWARYHIAIAGAISPTTATRTGIDGFVNPL
jgi:hypothetical protein